MTDVQTLPDDYKCQCAVCGGSVVDNGPQPFKTLSVGRSPETASLMFVVFFCKEHDDTDTLDTIKEWMRLFLPEKLRT